MSGFDNLHPALQHHIVNSLNWRELRPFQDDAVGTILAGKHVLIIAPTAGGKTEAALLPVLSRMLTEGWTGLSVLYVCPIKALINDLAKRLDRYCSLLGRRAALWHGDVGASARRRIVSDPPDCLLTTPESIEVILTSSRVDAQELLGNVHVVIIDEVHAFAGDDRGWHLLAVLSRVARFTTCPLQRVGLSATVGNPDELLEWLVGPGDTARTVLLPRYNGPARADVKVDYVGSLGNAAHVISRFHRGEKRLVFVDSRSQAEQLGAALRERSVPAFVTHSSLSRTQRRQAEEAFANRDDAVIVATSVLELGVDIGDLDWVIQIDAPSTVASFLQRMGRSGRRAGSSRNCLFLATKDESLLRALALVDLWSSGYVEPVRPPECPYHILAQQLLALALQERGIGRQAWRNWLKDVPGLENLPEDRVEQTIEWIVRQGILWDDNGVLWFGREGEKVFGRKNFLELLTVFTSPPYFTVRYGAEDIGFADESVFFGEHSDDPQGLLLGGQAWRVVSVDWRRHVAYVEPSGVATTTHWRGTGRGLSFRLCQTIKGLLISALDSDFASQRARLKLGEIRREFEWLDADSSTIVGRPGKATEWWTFAGHGANAGLVNVLDKGIGDTCSFDSTALRFGSHVAVSAVEQAIEKTSLLGAEAILPRVSEKALEGLKFSSCLPPELARDLLQRRLRDLEGTRWLLEHPISHVKTS